MRSKLILTTVAVLLLLGLPPIALTLVQSASAQAQSTWTASFSVSGTNNSTGFSYSVTGHFSFTLSNLSGTAGTYHLLANLTGQCTGHFTHDDTVSFSATYNSGANQISFAQLSAGMPPSGYVPYSCSVGTGGSYANYMTSTPFKASPFSLSLANGATTQISGTGYFGALAGTIVILSGTTVVTSFSSSSSSTTTTPTPTFSLSSTETTTTTSSSSSSSGGGIPEFPYQLVAVALFAAILVSSYLVVRQRNSRQDRS